MALRGFAFLGALRVNPFPVNGYGNRAALPSEAYSPQLKSRAASPCLDRRVTAFLSKDTNVSPPSQAPS